MKFMQPSSLKIAAHGEGKAAMENIPEELYRSLNSPYYIIIRTKISSFNLMIIIELSNL